MTDSNEKLEIRTTTSSKHMSRTVLKASPSTPIPSKDPTDPICKKPNAKNFAKYREYTEYIRNSGVLKLFGRCILSIYGSKSWPPQEKLMEQILNGMGDQIADKKVVTELSNQKKSMTAKLKALKRERDKLCHRLDEYEGSGVYYQLENADDILNPMPDNCMIDEEMLNDLFSRMKLPPDSRDNESSSPILGDSMGSPMPENLLQEETKTDAANLAKLLQDMFLALGFKSKKRELVAELSTNKRYMNEILQAFKHERPEKHEQFKDFKERLASYGLLETKSHHLPSSSSMLLNDMNKTSPIDEELLTKMFTEMEELTPDSRDRDNPDWLFACSEETQVYAKPCKQKWMPM